MHSRAYTGNPNALYMVDELKEYRTCVRGGLYIGSCVSQSGCARFDPTAHKRLKETHDPLAETPRLRPRSKLL